VVDRNFERRLAGLVNSGERAILRGGRKGVEKESLRVSPDGAIARTRHPEALGAPLTNEHITTDFSEALIELVTPPFGETWELLQYLCDLHQFVYRHLRDELLWATSMPSAINGDASIPLAQFGRSGIVEDLVSRVAQAFARNLEARVTGSVSELEARTSAPLAAGSLLRQVLVARLKSVFARLFQSGR